MGFGWTDMSELFSLGWFRIWLWGYGTVTELGWWGPSFYHPPAGADGMEDPAYGFTGNNSCA